jgi:hypothetical protein
MCSSSIPTKSNVAVGIMRKRGSALICDAWKETLSMAGCMLSEMSTSKSGIKTNSSAAGDVEFTCKDEFAAPNLINSLEIKWDDMINFLL